MNEFLQDSVFFGVFISIVTYEIGALIKRKWNVAIFNPLLISIALIIVFLILFNVDYDTYEFGAQYLSYFLTPATVALAVPLYEQIEPLKNNWKAIIAGLLHCVYSFFRLLWDLTTSSMSHYFQSRLRQPSEWDFPTNLAVL